MSGRTLRFVERRSDVRSPEPSTDFVVLDATWTPVPGGRSDVRSIRPTLQSVLERAELFEGSLERLDAWSAAADLPAKLTIDGVSWWPRIRLMVRWDFHALMLWRHVVSVLAQPGLYGQIVIPAQRKLLVEAARAVGPSTAASIVLSHERPSLAGPIKRWARDHVRDSILRRVRTAIAWISHGPRRTRDLARRVDLLDARVDGLRARPPSVLAIAVGRSSQLIRSDGQERFADPNMASVLDRLAQEGCPVATVALASKHEDDEDWARMVGNDRLLPYTFVRRRYQRSDDDGIDAGDVAARVASTGSIPLMVAGADLGPGLLALIKGHTGGWLDGQCRWIVWAERLLRDLRPEVVFIDRVGSRTLWMAAARRLGIPVIAMQHGVIYPSNPDYCYPSHPGLLSPHVMCVFGTYEREMLLDHSAFAPETIRVTGSPRADPDQARTPSSVDERAEVRGQLGVAEGDRLLVVSVANNPVGGDIHSVMMVARLLDGPLPGVHLVIKLHPVDRTVGTYEALLAGLAEAGGYRPTPLTVVRDVDLYRLLRSADAHLGQYSTVLTDAVAAGTPNMIAVGQAYSDIIGYVDARVAVPVRSVDDVRTFMRDPRSPEPEDRERFLDLHFQRGDSTGRIAAVIKAAMRPTWVGQPGGPGEPNEALSADG